MKEVKNMDLFDEDLKEIMGDRYDDGETPTEMPVMECKKAAPQPAPKKCEAVQEQYIPFHKERSLMDRLRSCAEWIGICGGISMLMWWFEVNGLMAMEAAYPCILACGIIGAFGAGMNFKN